MKTLNLKRPNGQMGGETSHAQYICNYLKFSFLIMLMLMLSMTFMSVVLASYNHHHVKNYRVQDVEGVWFKDRIGGIYTLQAVAMKTRKMLSATYSQAFSAADDGVASRSEYSGAIRKVGRNKFTTTAMSIVRLSDSSYQTWAFEGVMTFLDENNIKIVWGDPIDGPGESADGCAPNVYIGCSADFWVLSWPATQGGNTHPLPRSELPDVPFIGNYDTPGVYTQPFISFPGRDAPAGPGYVEYYQKVPHPRAYVN